MALYSRLILKDNLPRKPEPRVKSARTLLATNESFKNKPTGD